MSIKLGGITPTGTFGGWTFFDELLTDYPQELDLALDTVFKTNPLNLAKIYAIGCQVVNGTNYLCIGQRERNQNGKTVEDFITFVINIPLGTDGYKNAKIIKQEVADETILSDDAEKAFSAATSQLVGTVNKPLIELGFSPADKGIDYHFICQSKPVYPAARPYLTYFVINFFNGVYSIVTIKQ